MMSKKGVKQVGQVTSRERGELVTMCAVVSATGVALPPVFVFPRKNYRDVFMNGAPEGSLGLVNQSGWMNGVNFVKVLEHIVKFTGCSTNHQIIVIMDNHESHINLNSVMFAKEKGINIVTLPPHTSNKTQPLDLSVFRPLKAYFNGAANVWMLTNPGKTISIYQMVELMGEAWLKAATPLNIKSAFKTAGIWPLDRHVFRDEQFLPSSIADRDSPISVASPVACTVYSPAVQVLNSTSTPSSSSPVPEVIVPAESGVNLPSSSVISSPAIAVPSTSRPCSSTFVSPQQFRGYPKVSLTA